MKFKTDLTRRLEALEAETEAGMPVTVWVDNPADADRLIAEAKQKHLDRKILTISWGSKKKREAA